MGLFSLKSLFGISEGQQSSSFLASNQGCVWTFYSDDGQDVVVELNPIQNKLYNARLRRKFKNAKRADEIKAAIKEAKTIVDINTVAQDNDICDISELDGININAAKNVISAVLDALLEFSILRSKFCFIGTDTAYEKYKSSIKCGDTESIEKFGLGQIIPHNDINKLAFFCELESFNVNTIARAVSSCGFLDGIIIRQTNFTNENYSKTLSNLYQFSLSGFSPVGCSTLKSVIDHEVGHLLDFHYGVSKRRAVIEYFERLSPTEIKIGLSEYAANSIQEFIAESYTEYKNNPKARKIATIIGREVG